MAEEIIVNEPERKAFLVDLTRCIGCRACQVACEEWHEDRMVGEGDVLELYMPWGGRTAENPKWNGGVENPPALSPRTMSRIHFMEPEGFAPDTMGGVAWWFQRISCNHCREAACQDVCPVPGCITHNPESGFLVVLDPETCVGCTNCVSACPFGVPQFDPETKKAYKCNGCHERVQQNGLPLCVQACPTGALQFGMRSSAGEGDVTTSNTMETLMERRFNAAYDRALRPVKYGHEKGEKAALGGLGAMYVLEATPGTYAGLPPTPKMPAPIAVARDIWANLAWVFSAGAVILAVFQAIAFGRLGEKVKLSEEEETYIPTDEELEQEFKQKRLEGKQMAVKQKFIKHKKIKGLRPPKGRKIK